MNIHVIGVVGHVGEQKCNDNPRGPRHTWKSDWPTSYCWWRKTI